MELAKVFLRDTPEEKRLFELLRSAYVEARYTDDFVVTKEDIDALMPKSNCSATLWKIFAGNNSTTTNRK